MGLRTLLKLFFSKGDESCAWLCIFRVFRECNCSQISKVKPALWKCLRFCTSSSFASHFEFLFIISQHYFYHLCFKSDTPFSVQYIALMLSHILLQLFSVYDFLRRCLPVIFIYASLFSWRANLLLSLFFLCIIRTYVLSSVFLDFAQHTSRHTLHFPAEIGTAVTSRQPMSG
jgi:hypothetical protein